MNRQSKRAQEKEARRRSKETNAIVAMHEAGHAVAKVIAVGEMGFDVSQAISHIEIGPGEARLLSADKKALLQSQGVTYGHVFSREIETAAQEYKSSYLAGRDSIEGRDQIEFLSKMLELGRSAEADIDRWFRARVFDSVSGSIAEAIISDRTFDEIWHGHKPRMILRWSYEMRTLRELA